jgi:hypothetical protein
MLELYLTIWIGLTLFVLGETGRSFATTGTRAPAWAWWTFSAGLVLTIVHTLIAFAVVHNWVHGDAVRGTARQTEAVFGVAVGWGVYVNYAFMAVWFADAWGWRAAPSHRRPAPLVWTLRAFYMVMIFNGAIVFASGAGRVLGIALVSWLCICWAPRRLTPVLSARHR